MCNIKIGAKIERKSGYATHYKTHCHDSMIKSNKSDLKAGLDLANGDKAAHATFGVAFLGPVARLRL